MRTRGRTNAGQRRRAHRCPPCNSPRSSTFSTSRRARVPVRHASCARARGEPRPSRPMVHSARFSPFLGPKTNTRNYMGSLDRHRRVTFRASNEIQSFQRQCLISVKKMETEGGKFFASIGNSTIAPDERARSPFRDAPAHVATGKMPSSTFYRSCTYPPPSTSRPRPLRRAPLAHPASGRPRRS